METRVVDECGRDYVRYTSKDKFKILWDTESLHKKFHIYIKW
jgi:hypothetical protein